MNQYLDNYEVEKLDAVKPDPGRGRPMFGRTNSEDPTTRALLENLELINELEGPILELIEVPKVNYKLKLTAFKLQDPIKTVKYFNWELLKIWLA